MRVTKLTKVKDLNLDLNNFRTVPQPDEVSAIKAMISISPDRFWALMESIIADGYLPTENIIVIKKGGDLIVREGNRRIAVLKLIYGHLPSNDILLPDNIKTSVTTLSQNWKDANEEVPCTIYDQADAASVDKIVTLAHGKGEKASRDQWNAVARARHNRDILKMTEPAIDLLEKYIKSGMNLTPNQATRWSGDYPLSVLDEAMKKIAPRLGLGNAADLSRDYPTIKLRDELENIVKDIGLQNIRFDTIRSKSSDFATTYGIPPLASATTATGASTAGTTSSPTSTPASTSSTASTGGAGSATGTTGPSATSPPGKTPAVSINDPKAVSHALKTFVPLGANRQKVVTLLDEAKRLNLNRNPIAFCFLLRSMFEISAKAYCDDHKASGLKAKKPSGDDRKLVDVLRDITKHLTSNGANKNAVKELHGAMAELGKAEGILSVTSMNHLVHSPTFSLTANDISSLFGNIFPLLHAMNQ